MNRSRKEASYDRIAVGKRIQTKRQILDISQDELAERIDRATKYVSDIERGNCGMSIETMMMFAKELDMSLDYMVFGKGTDDEINRQTIDMYAALHVLGQYKENERTYAVRLLNLFLAAMRDIIPDETSES